MIDLRPFPPLTRFDIESTTTLWSKIEKNKDKIAIQSFNVPRAREWAKWVVRANEQTDERVAQYYSVFLAVIDHSERGVSSQCHARSAQLGENSLKKWNTIRLNFIHSPKFWGLKDFVGKGSPEMSSEIMTQWKTSWNLLFSNGKKWQFMYSIF